MGDDLTVGNAEAKSGLAQIGVDGIGVAHIALALHPRRCLASAPSVVVRLRVGLQGRVPPERGRRTGQNQEA
jgi:hypothetical protein